MSNRLTFSLASLVFLIALGLVFAPTSVLAHTQSGQEPYVTGTTDPADHTHDGMKPIDAVDGNDDDSLDDPEDVPAHNSHPTATIALKSGDTDTVRGNMAVVTTTAATFTLEIDFDQVVAASGTTPKPLTGLPTNPLEADGTDFTYDVLNVASTPAVVSGAVESVAVTRGTTGKKFTAVVTMNTTNGIPSGTADADDETLTFRIILDQNSVYSYRTTGTSPGPGQNPPTYGGGANAQSTLYTFKLVKTLPALIPAKATVTVEEGASTGAAFTATFTFDKAVSDFKVSDIKVTGGSAADPVMDTTDTTKTAGTVWTSLITPSVNVSSVVVTVVSGSTKVAPATTGGTQTVSSLPTVTIAPPASATVGTAFTTKFTFSEAVSDFADTDITLTGVEAIADTPAKDTTITDGTVWNADITARAAGSLSIGVKSTKATGPLKSVTVSDSGLTLAAKGYLVIVGDGFDSKTLPGVTTLKLAKFPDDLAAFFIAGGTIDVVATGGDVIINELMVARDANKLGAPPSKPTDGQWIELHNKDAAAAATGISVTFSDKQPAPAEPPGLQDRLSNVVDKGWNFEGKFGAAVLSGSTHPTNPVNFVSIRRTNAGKNGWDQEAWGTAVASLLFAPGRVGTPGAANTVETFKPATDSKPAKNVIISEVANRMGTDGDANEWIELKGPAGESLNGYQITIIKLKADNSEKEEMIYDFPDGVKISDNGHLLLTDKDPVRNELAPDFADEGVPTPKRYKVVTLGALPDDGHFVLVLRSSDKTDPNNIEDIAGSPYMGDPAANSLSRPSPKYTTLWPLTGNVGTLNSRNKLVGGKVYQRVPGREGVDGYSQNSDKADQPAFAARGFTGIGYDRNAAVSAENGGTPGYPNNSLKNYQTEGAGTAMTPVLISEIMYATGDRTNMPQWIELRNTSKTEGINLDGWRVTIINHDQNSDDAKDEFTGDLSKNYALSGNIPPNQTFLLVAYAARDETRLPPERIHRLRSKRGELILSQYAFEITLYPKAKDNKDANRQVTDQVGNLAAKSTGRVRNNPRSYETPAWTLPAGTNDEGDRISIVRVSMKKNPANPVDGLTPAGWKRFDMVKQTRIDETSYGHSTDISSPGHHFGGVLPVSLSKFRPERLDDGSIVVRWITESELNNAGFNILRSVARDGQFTKLNEQMIKGQGTTSERTVYDFVDKTAKPNVVYYYQIQDVSLDGDVVTLRTSRLKGHISAAGKATTTWGELKALQ